ncbi:MAG: tetratricopeptide repeat protein [Caulobacteraceae bacterium]
MADVFNEVDEQVRSAQLQHLFRRGWPYAVGVAVVALVIALAAWGLNQREISQNAAASERYAKAMQTLANGDAKGADANFADLSHTAPKAYRALAYMQQAGIALKRNDAPAAIALLDQAAQVAPNLIMADTARLQAAYAAMDVDSYADVRARLAPLAETGRPYRMMAHEALGVLELANGHIPQARGDLQIVSLSSDATDAARNRAAAALDLIKSGAWSSLAPLAKASVGLTPQAPPPTAPGAMPGAADGQAPSDQSQSAPQSGSAQ